MSSVLQSAQMFLCAGVLFLLVGSAASALLARTFAGLLWRWEPRARHRVLFLLAALPVLTAFALLLSAVLPSLVALVVPALDHCAAHDDGHAHLCFVHLPTVSLNMPWLLGLVFLASYLVLRAALGTLEVLRARQILSVLARTGQPRRDLNVAVIDTSLPICLAAGLFEPRVLISRGLLASLSDEELAVVVAHEHAHVRRRDALIASSVRMLSLLHLPQVARWIVRELEIAAEQACDEQAALVVKDRTAVASAILTVERSAQHATIAQLAPLVASFGQCAVARRVESLLAEPAPAKSLRALAAWLGLAFLSVLLVADHLHHLTESLLSSILF
jgi:beta-lactamase regulating signal transducer with metallopeptidase domain